MAKAEGGVPTGAGGAAVPDPGRPPVSRGFIARFTLAQIGAFIGFVPLLAVLLPIKAAALTPDGSALLLSQAAMSGALAAGVSHLVSGTLSDRAAARSGTRKPWIIVGALLTVLTYGGVILARTPIELIASIVVFQLCFNIMFSPLMAVFADQVPDNQKGLVSAFSGLAYPVASLFAALVIAVALTDLVTRAVVTALTLLVLLTPLAVRSLRIPAGSVPGGGDAPASHGSALADRDFRIAFLSRLAVQTAIALNTLYLLIYLQQDSDAAVRLPDLRIEAVLGLLIAAATVAALVAGFITGVISDRRGGRKGFVTLGGLLICAGAGVLAVAPAWPGPLLGQILYGLGVGIFSTADQALIAQVLPTRARIGRDLGVMNVAVTLPQVLAPLAGLVLLGPGGWSLPAVFAASAGLAFGGGVLVQGIRRRL